MTAAGCRKADDETLRREVDLRSDLPVLLLSRLGFGGAILAAQCHTIDKRQAKENEVVETNFRSVWGVVEMKKVCCN